MASVSQPMSEWRLLKSLVSQFALDNQGFGKNKFKWSKGITGQPRLSIGDVVVTFSDRGEHNGEPQECKLLFSYQQRFAASPPLQNQRWSLTPELVNGKFAWRIRESGKVLSPAQLAEEVATEVIRQHLSYEQGAKKALA